MVYRYMKNPYVWTFPSLLFRVSSGSLPHLAVVLLVRLQIKWQRFRQRKEINLILCHVL